MKRDDVGDVTMLRADGHWAYHLAVVVDDAEQGVTDVVRGADLLHATSAHLALQQALHLPSPRYAHVALLTNDLGQKLSKQTRAEPVDPQKARIVLDRVFAHLGLPPVDGEQPQVMLNAALPHWRAMTMEA